MLLARLCVLAGCGRCNVVVGAVTWEGMMHRVKNLYELMKAALEANSNRCCDDPHDLECLARALTSVIVCTPLCYDTADASKIARVLRLDPLDGGQ